LKICRRAEFFNRPAAPGGRVFARESLGWLVEWARATASRHVADRSLATTLRSEWRHPLVEVLSKEGYNILAEFNAALDGEAYGDACQIISSADPQAALGLLPDAKDSRLLVSLPAAVSLAMREYPKLRQTMNEQFGARGRLRVRQAIAEGDLMALEAATMQFCGTEAAAEAHLWLGDRAMAAGDFLHAIGQYRQALEGKIPPAVVQPRMRLAAAMLGRDEGQPVTVSVSLNGLQLKPDQFEALIEEMLARGDGTEMAMPAPDDSAAGETLAPPPGRYEPHAWAQFTGDLGREPQQTDDASIDFAGRQLAPRIVDDLMLVANRFQIVAYELKSGRQRWANRLDKQQGYAKGWPSVPMPPVVAGDRVYARRLTNQAGRSRPELVCLNLEDGKLIWTARFNDHVVSDPLVAQDQLLALTISSTQDNYLQLSLAAFDPRNGEVLFRRPLVQMRDAWDGQVPCQAITVDDRILATAGGGVLCCDLLGQVHWLRRQTWLARALEDDRWRQQFVQPPLEADGLLYVTQSGVRTVECLETATGRLRWQHVLLDIRRICGLVDGKLIVETASSVEAFDAETGASAWRRPATPLTGQACGAPGGVVIVDNERIDNDSWRPTLVWLDPASGREMGRSPLSKFVDKQPMLGPLVVHEDRLWAFFGRGGREAAREIYQLRPAGEPVPGVALSDPLRRWPVKFDHPLEYAAASSAAGWTLLSAATDGSSRWHAELRGQSDVLVTLASDKRSTRFVRLLSLPAGSHGTLVLKVGHEPDGQWGLDVRIGGDSLLSQTIDKSVTADGWREFTIDLSPYAGRDVWLIVLHRPVGDKPSHAAWQRLEVLIDPVSPTDPLPESD
jgi:outer membrane protein assembly factor BamB